MMMPANYSVIAENEMTYVVGGGVIEAIGAVTAPIWTVDNVKTFNTNIVTLVGNWKVDNVVNSTVGYAFSGNASWEGLGKAFKNLFVAENKHVGDSIATTLGTIAAVYNLGNATVANTAGSVKLHYGAKASAKYTFKDADGDTVLTIW